MADLVLEKIIGETYSYLIITLKHAIFLSSLYNNQKFPKQNWSS